MPGREDLERPRRPAARRAPLQPRAGQDRQRQSRTSSRPIPDSVRSRSRSEPSTMRMCFTCCRMRTRQSTRVSGHIASASSSYVHTRRIRDDDPGVERARRHRHSTILNSVGRSSTASPRTTSTRRPPSVWRSSGRTDQEGLAWNVTVPSAVTIRMSTSNTSPATRAALVGYAGSSCGGAGSSPARRNARRRPSSVSSTRTRPKTSVTLLDSATPGRPTIGPYPPHPPEKITSRGGVHMFRRSARRILTFPR